MTPEKMFAPYTGGAKLGTGVSDLQPIEKKNAPAPQDYLGAAQEEAAAGKAAAEAQTRANRPDQTNAFGASVNWTEGPDGQWSQSQSLGGPLGDYANGLMGQAGAQGPMDWSQFGEINDGSAAREQAITSAYGDATKRLNPQWDQRETQMRSRLANQGLDPNSEAARNANQEFTSGRNDAYGSAMANAIRQGDSAGNSVFRNSMMSRQQAIAEALRKRGQPMDELNALRGLTGQQGFMGAAGADPTQYRWAAGMKGNAEMQKWMAEQQANADAWSGGMSLLGAGGSLFGLGG